MPTLAREACEGAKLPAPPAPGETEYQVYSLRMVGKLEKCDGKRELAVAAGDLHNAYVDRLVTELRPPTLWERITGRRR